ARRPVEDEAFIHVDLELVAGADPLDQPPLGLERHEVPAVDAVAEEDPRVELGDDTLDARLGHRQRGVLAAGAGAKVLAADDDRVVAPDLILPNQPENSRRE